MRENLQKVAGKRCTFTAKFSRFGRKNKRVPGPHGWYEKEFITVLLVDIKDLAGTEVCDHLWFNLTKGFQDIGMKAGDVIQFDARSNPYWKGYQGSRDEGEGQEQDYKLVFPTHIRRVEQNAATDLPLFKQ